MSKATKALAIFGVVAGLGLSMVPMATYAADPAPTVNNGAIIVDGTGINGTPAGTKYDQNADGKVTDSILVKTTIDRTLSIAIAGANDADAGDDATANHLVLLGSGKLLNGAGASGTADVTVITNDTKGYRLAMKGQYAGLQTADTDGDVIPAVVLEGAGSTAGELDKNTGVTKSAFGYQIAGKADYNDNGDDIIKKGAGAWAAVNATGTGDEVVVNTSETAATGDQVTFTFKAVAAPNQAAGTYKNTLTFTASAGQE